MNELFSGKSIAEMGTLCQLKNYFGHRNVSTDVMNCFNYADNFIRFVTEAHVAYLAVDVLGMKDIDGWRRQEFLYHVHLKKNC